MNIFIFTIDKFTYLRVIIFLYQFRNGDSLVHTLADIGHRIITIFWRLLFLLTLYFAWTSTNLTLGDNWTFGTSTTWVTTAFVILVLAIVISLIAYPRVRQIAKTIFIDHQLLTAGSLLLLIVIWQFIFVTYVHPVSGFDAGMLHYAAVNPKHVLEIGVSSYYSLNQNNLPIMLFMRWLVVHTGQTSWQFFDYLTIIFVDVSALFNLLTIAIVKRRSLGIGLYLHAAWLAVFPSILMPYTDAWVLPFVSIQLFCAAVISQNQFSLLTRLGAALLLGPTIAITYFLKPSAIIPVIAMVIVAGLTWLAKTHHWTQRGSLLTLGVILMTGTAGGGTYLAINHTVQNQDYIQINRSRAIPAIHFAAMGVYGEGGYSDKQAIQMAVLPTEAQKTAYSKKMLLTRLRQLGPWGYFKFLILKQRNNTADGTFGWLKEGHFFRENQKPSQHGFSNQLKNYIFLYGTHIADFRFIAQFWWIGLLTLIAFGWGDQLNFREILRLSLVGGFLFLLLFEGGRSRYLIQYLPCFLLLATLATKRSWHTFRLLAGRFNGTQPTNTKN